MKSLCLLLVCCSCAVTGTVVEKTTWPAYSGLSPLGGQLTEFSYPEIPVLVIEVKKRKEVPVSKEVWDRTAVGEEWGPWRETR